ncbi:MAG: hypothetical protein AAB786_00700 [Patescibacteria group bacterium]
MSQVSELEGKVRWNEEELQIRRRKLEDAKQAVREIEQTLEQRKQELSDARRDEQSEKEKTKSSTSKK